MDLVQTMQLSPADEQLLYFPTIYNKGGIIEEEKMKMSE